MDVWNTLSSRCTTSLGHWVADADSDADPDASVTTIPLPELSFRRAKEGFVEKKK